MKTNITAKYTPSDTLRPNRSAIHGSIRQPAMVPAESSIVPYEANRAASAAGTPSRVARYVTDEGTYTDPAHNPTIETSSSAALITVRPRYSNEKSARNASRAVH